MKVKKEHFLDDITPYGGECYEGDNYEFDFGDVSYWFRSYVDEPQRMYFWKKTVEGEHEPLMNIMPGEAAYFRECIDYFRREPGITEFRKDGKEIDLSSLPCKGSPAAELYWEVHRAWAGEAIPAEPILDEKYSDSMDARKIREWASGTHWYEMNWLYHLGRRAGLESPFHYLTPEAGAYYIGWYLAYVLECFYEGYDSSMLQQLVFAAKTEKFDLLLAAMSEAQREMFLAVMSLVAAQPEVFELSPEELEGLTVMLGKLGA